MDIKKLILSNISNRLKTRYKIMLHFNKKYTLDIYKMGYNDAYNFKDVGGCKMTEKIEK